MECVQLSVVKDTENIIKDLRNKPVRRSTSTKNLQPRCIL
jgi:hypothetical protein